MKRINSQVGAPPTMPEIRARIQKLWQSPEGQALIADIKNFWNTNPEAMALKERMRAAMKGAWASQGMDGFVDALVEETVLVI